MLKGLRKLFQKDTLVLPIYNHAILELLIFSRIKNEFARTLLIPVQIVTEILAMTIWAILLITFALFNGLVDCYLKLKYGEQYVGLLDGMSTMIACTKRPVIQFVMFLQANKTPSQILNHFLTNGERMKEVHKVLNCVVNYELGYQFYKWINIDISELIKPISGYTNANDFNMVLDNIASKSLPQNDEYLWEIYIGDTQISWPDEQSTNQQIPVIFRFNHLLGDGASIMSLCTAYFIDQGVAEVKRRCGLFKSTVQKTKTSNINCLNWFSSLKSFYDLKDRKLILNSLLNPERKHILHNGLTGNRKMCVYGLDSDDGKYFQKIREIKRRKTNLKFNGIIFTAICASLADYINSLQSQEKCISKPENINIIVPYYFPRENFNELVDLKNPECPIINLSNKFTAAHYKFPLDYSTEFNNNNLFALLTEISKRSKAMMKSLDLLFLEYLMGTVFQILPLQLIQLFNQTNDGTAVISNMPGYAGEQAFCCGCEESDMIVWTMNLQTTGLTFLIFTHNNRLRLTLQLDGNFIDTRKGGQLIVDGIFNYIDRLVEVTK